MTAEAKPSRLGRGLSALLGEAGESAPAPKTPAAKLAIDLIEPNAHQPRRRFAEDEMAELTASIRTHGVLQPIIVRPHPEKSGHYQIVAGERRWRASQSAGLHELPAIVRNLTESDVLEIALIENVQRADLNPVEEATGYDALIKECQYTQESLAKAIGKSRSHVANTLRLLTLPDRVRTLLETGQITAGQARPLVGHAAAAVLADEVVRNGLSAREAEALAKRGDAKPRAAAAKPAKDADTKLLEEKLREELGLKVAIEHKGEGGKVMVSYKTLEELDEVCRRLCTRPGGSQAL